MSLSGTIRSGGVGLGGGRSKCDVRDLTMSDCPLGTLYSKAAAPSESRKDILPGRSILKTGETETVRDMQN